MANDKRQPEDFPRKEESPAMTISQGIKMKGRVEESILTLLEAYSKETGLTVDDIALQVVEEFTIGMREPKLRPVRVTLRVRL